MSAEDKARYEEAAIGLSKEQLQRLQNIFDRHDTNKSGEIDVSPLPAGERTRQTRAGWSLICGAEEHSARDRQGGRDRASVRSLTQNALCDAGARAAVRHG